MADHDRLPEKLLELCYVFEAKDLEIFRGLPSVVLATFNRSRLYAQPSPLGHDGALPLRSQLERRQNFYERGVCRLRD